MDKRLKDIFIDSLGLEPSYADWTDLKYRSIREWDSVAHMALVAEIEDAFGVMLETDDVIGMSSFEETKSILRRYGVESD